MNTQKKQKRSILGTIGRGLVKPFTVPFGWIKADAKQQADNLKNHWDSAYARQTASYTSIYDLHSGKSITGRSMNDLSPVEILVNLKSLRARWFLFVFAYLTSVSAALWLLGTGQSGLGMVAAFVWAILFYLRSMRLAWSSVRLSQHLAGLDSGISSKNWYLANWKSEFPLPPKCYSAPIGDVRVIKSETYFAIEN